MFHGMQPIGLSLFLIRSRNMIRDKYSAATVFGHLEDTLNTLDHTELHWCRVFNQYIDRKSIERLFAVVSRIGDGMVWYLTMLMLPLVWGVSALVVVLKMLLVGGAGLFVYRQLKQRTQRLRPCRRHQGINHPVAPLDEFSFPSGHTLHAVGFTAVAGMHFPALLWFLAPLTVLIAMSRVVLGLHYPSDVIVGALIGWVLAMVVILL